MVDVGLVGVMLAVTVLVGDDVAVGGSGVAVDVGDAASVGVEVGVSSGGFVFGIKVKANRRISPMMMGIPYLIYAGGRESSVFLYGATVGGSPV